MGYRGTDGTEVGGCRYRVVEVTSVENSPLPAGYLPAVLIVDNSWDTLCLVQESLEEMVDNMMRVKKMDAQQVKHVEVEESAALFEKNLEPLFALISATKKEHVLDKFSSSLKKALLLMAMERYSCDSGRICLALGISRWKLEKELRRCGLLPQEASPA